MYSLWTILNVMIAFSVCSCIGTLENVEIAHSSFFLKIPALQYYPYIVIYR